MVDSNKTIKKDNRTKNWTCVVYPDSAPDNWRDILDDLHIPWVESPLHDRDVNADGEPKKSHWHVMLLFSSNKSYEQVKDITSLLCAPNPQKVASARSMVRYFAHIDNPEKYQYDKSLIVAHGGAEIDRYLSATTSERYQIIADMMDFIDDNNILEMEDILRYSRRERFLDWFPLLCDNSAYIIAQYIKSKRHRQKDCKDA